MGQSVANLVDMRDVSFSRGDRCIFDNISLTVPRGKITAIMGPSGYGYIKRCEWFLKFGKMANEALKKCMFCVKKEQKCGRRATY